MGLDFSRRSPADDSSGYSVANRKEGLACLGRADFTVFRRGFTFRALLGRMKMEIWILVLIAILTVLAGILWLRLHPFLVLMLAGLIVAVGTTDANLRSYADAKVAAGSMDANDVDKFVVKSAPKRLAEAFGATAGNVGILIALAGVIGVCLMASGGAMVIVDTALRIVGERQAPVAMAASSFVLGIPVFFDTVFYLMVPLARSLRRRTGKHYVLYILAIMAGGSIAHSLIPPTPGPLQVAEIIGVDLITLVFVGLIVGALSSVLSLAAAWLIDSLVDVPLRPLEGSAERDERAEWDGATANVTEEAGESMDKIAATGPPLILSLLPILLPIILIASQTATKMWLDTEPGWAEKEIGIMPSLIPIIKILGDKNVALGIGAAISLALLFWAPKNVNRQTLIGDAMASSGVVILITSAGGAFGAMLGQSGVAERMANLGTEVPGLMLLPIAFGLTAAIRTVQGSATVAMITSAGILQGLATGDVLPFHPVYLALAIGGGSKPVAWMTDSGFWIMCKMSGMTESEGLRTVSPLTIAMGLSTLLWTMLGAALVPLR